METIKTGTFAHGYKLSKHRFQIVQTPTNILIYMYISKWGFLVTPISLNKPLRQWKLVYYSGKEETDIVDLPKSRTYTESQYALNKTNADLEIYKTYGTR